MLPEPLPITVVVPHIGRREEFFRRFCLPSIEANFPQQIIIENDEPALWGPAKMRNAGAKKASNPYLFFCDDDVILGGNSLAILYNALKENPAAGYAYCDYLGVIVPGAPLHRMPSPVFHIKSRPFDPGELRIGNYISTMSLIRREVFPGFDESIRCLEDWDLWLTLLKRGIPGVYVPETLFHAYFLDSGVSALANRDLSGSMGRVLNKHFPG